MSTDSHDSGILLTTKTGIRVNNTTSPDEIMIFIYLYNYALFRLIADIKLRHDIYPIFLFSLIADEVASEQDEK